jgi:deoxyribose-phosphate aldolase
MSTINSLIDHTLLKPEATRSDIKALCKEAIDNKFYSVCVTPFWVSTVRHIFDQEDVDVKIATVIDFPHGNLSFNAKTELLSIYDVFVDEFDIVANISAIKSGEWATVEQEIKAVRNETGNPIKYIVEVGYLTDAELFKVADLLIRHKIDFIKTCTGYGPRTVTVEDISKIKNHVGDRILIKASGGIKTYEFAKQLVDAGANRLGTSSSINIIKGASTNAGETPILGGY